MATLVCFHAHPDDEAITTAGVMAQWADAGHRVVLVLATRGELGEPSPGVLRPGEPLWQRRVEETERSAEIIGAGRVEFLGYTDSGMMGEPSNDEPGCFWQADVEEAASRLADVLRDEAVDVLTIYDAHGVYGHPDHIQVHRVGRRAAELVGLSPERVLCSTMNRDVLRERWLAEAEQARRSAEVAAEERPDPDRPDPDRPDPDSNDFDIDTFGLPDAEITHAVDVRSVIERKARSMRAHRSQIAEDGFLLSEPGKFEEAFGIEWFASLGARRAQGAPFRARLLEAG